MKANSLSEQVYDSLLEDLSKGKIKIGDKIVIDHFANLYGVSHTPVREAINRLIAVGALSYKPNYSTFVPDISLKEYREIITLRIFIEGAAAEQAVEVATDNDHDLLSRMQEKIDHFRVQGDYESLMVVNREFHFYIINLANLPMYKKIMELLWARTGPALHLLRGSSSYEPNESHPHWRFIAAVKNKRPQDGRSAMEEDIRRALLSLEGRLQPRSP